MPRTSNDRSPSTRVDSAIVAVVVSASLFGASTPLARALVGSLDPLWLAGALYAGSGLGLSCYLLLRPGAAESPQTLIAAADTGWLAAAIG